MVSGKEAFARARQCAAEAPGEMDHSLEEVERDSYEGQQVWQITPGFPKRRPAAPELIRMPGASLPL